MYKKLFILPLIGTLAACGVSSTDGVLSRDANKGGIMGLAKVDDVKVDGAGALKGVTDVVIGSFKVGFVESAKQTNKAKGTFMRSAMGGKARGNVTLKGISDETKMEITNAAYNDFVSKLKAQGYNVVDRSVLTSSSEYSSMTKKQYPFLADNSGFLSEYGKTVFYQPSSLGSTGVSFMNDFAQSMSTSGFAGISNVMSAQGDAKVAGFAEKQKIAVLSATYVLDFAAAGGHAGISSASMKVGQNLAVTHGSVKLISGGTSTFKSGVANIYLGQPIESGKQFGELSNETSGADIALQETLNAATLLLGQGTNRSRTYSINADPAKYQAQSVDVLVKANTALLAKAH